MEAAKAGYFFSVPPIVCRSPGFQALVKAVPLESLLLETDSPALVRVQSLLVCFEWPLEQRLRFTLAPLSGSREASQTPYGAWVLERRRC